MAEYNQINLCTVIFRTMNYANHQINLPGASNMVCKKIYGCFEWFEFFTVSDNRKKDKNPSFQFHLWKNGKNELFIFPKC